MARLIRRSEALLGLSALTLAGFGLLNISQLRESERALAVARHGFERSQHDAVARVVRWVRYDDCLVVELNGRESGYRVVGAIRREGAWSFAPNVHGDTDDISDRSSCLDVLGAR